MIVPWANGGAFIAISSPSLPNSPHPPSLHVKPLVMMIFVLQDGWTPLMTASAEGHLDVVKILIEAGANVNDTNEVGKYMYTLFL